MLIIDGIKYLTVKEAAKQFGISHAWLKKQRYLRNPPIFEKISGKGKAYYNLKKTEEWFKNNMRKSDE